MAKTKSNNNFIAYVVDVLSPLGAVETHAMFGGRNVTLGGLTFGIVMKDVLYLKTDQTNRPSFEERGLLPFVYTRKGGVATATSYYAAPDCLDDWDALGPDVEGALAAARRAKAKKPAAKPKAARTTPGAAKKKPAAKKR